MFLVNVVDDLITILLLNFTNNLFRYRIEPQSFYATSFLEEPIEGLIELLMQSNKGGGGLNDVSWKALLPSAAD